MRRSEFEISDPTPETRHKSGLVGIAVKEEQEVGKKTLAFIGVSGQDIHPSLWLVLLSCYSLRFQSHAEIYGLGADGAGVQCWQYQWRNG